jgi:AraC-like DNA-binding protein
MLITPLLINDEIEKVDHELSLLHPILVFRHQLDRLTKPIFDVHYAVSLGIVLSGQVKMHYSNGGHLYGPGQIWFTGVWEPHGWNVTKAPYDVLYMFVSPEWIDMIRYEEAPELNYLDLFMSPANQRPRILESERPFFTALAKKYAKSLSHPQPYRQVISRILFQEIMLEIWVRHPTPPLQTGASFDSFLKINPAFYHLFSQKDYITEDQAAAVCHMSLKSFNNVFKEAMGTTFAKFSLRYRLNGVVTQLLQTRKSIKTIAYEWGFTNLSNLGHCFKKQFGCSPTEYCEKFNVRKS